MDQEWADRLYNWMATSGVRIVAIIVGGIVFYYLARASFRKALKIARKAGKGELVTREQEMRAKTLAGIIRGLLIGAIAAVIALMVLSELGYNVGPLLAGAGIAGLAIGFGAQTLVRDLIGGFFVLLEGQFYVGDVINVGSVGGTVEAIRLRTTLLRDGQGVLHVVPNGEMRVVSNLTRGWSSIVIDVRVDYREDLDRVIGILQGVCDKVAADEAVGRHIIEGPAVTGVEELNGKQVVICITGRTEAFRDSEVAREVRKLVAGALAEEKIVVATV